MWAPVAFVIPAAVLETVQEMLAILVFGGTAALLAIRAIR